MLHNRPLQLLLTILCLSSSVAKAQYLHSAGNQEIEVTVLSSDILDITIWNEESESTVYSGSASSAETWTANSDNPDESGVDVNLNELTLYKLTFNDGTFSADYFYYYCPNRNAPASEQFFCPYDDDPDNNDLVFEYDGTDLIVYVGGLKNTSTPDLNDHFSDEYWMVPYNMDIYCPGVPSACEASEIGFFLTPQTSSETTFKVTNKDLVVPSSDTWNWDGNFTLEFPTSRQLKVNGTLNAEDITLEAINSRWKGVYFSSGSDGAWEDVEVLDISGVWGGAGVKIYNAEPYFDGVTVDVNSGYSMYGLYLYGSNHAVYVVNDSKIKSASKESIFVSGSNNYVYLHKSDVIRSNSSYATVKVSNSGGVYFWPGGQSPYIGENQIWKGKLWATGNGVINAGTGLNTTSKNHFCDANSSNLKTTSGGTIYADFNYWHNDADPTQSGSNIFYDSSDKQGAESCPSNPPLSMQGGSDFVIPSTAAATNNEVESPLLDDLKTQLYDAKQKARTADYSGAISILASLVNTRDDTYAHVALQELGILFGTAKREDIQLIFEETSQENSVLGATALALLAGSYAANDQDHLAIETYNALIERFPGSSNAFYARLSLTDLYMQAGDFEQAEQSLIEAKPSDQDEEDELIAVATILSLESARFGKPVDAIAKLHRVEHPATLTENAVLQNSPSLPEFGNYPNPFNPSTTIQFSLPAPSHVRLAVFDLLGREIEVLLDGSYDAGPHHTVFDATNLPSGTYLYRIETQWGNHTQLMSVMK